jgi:hypothetical protein
VPPVGRLLGLPVVMDERVPQCSILVFRVFGESDYVELPYEDFALLEQPRIASFAAAGELPASSKATDDADAPSAGRG